VIGKTGEGRERRGTPMSMSSAIRSTMTSVADHARGSTFHYRAIHPAPDDPSAVTYVDTWVSYPGRYKCSDTFACMGRGWSGR